MMPLTQSQVEQDLAFELSLDHTDPFLRYVERLRTGLPPGVNIVGSILARTQALWDTTGLGEMANRMLASPGDRTLSYGDDDTLTHIGLGISIAYDIWYLFGAGNVLKFGGKDISESEEKMEEYFKQVDDAKALLSPETKPSATTYNLSGGGGNSVSPDTFGAKEHTIKEARFEVWETDGSENYSSDGPKEKADSYSGYIAFPMGPLGVMWGISLTTMSSLSYGQAGGSVKPVDGENSTIQGGDLLPPFNLGKTEVAGEKLMSKGYLIEDDTKVEILADAFEGLDNPELHQWMRYWITPDNKEIVPGEFVGLLCRPWPLHCWWFQETAPIVYSGNWVETEFYTSGIVKEVLEPPDPGGNGGGDFTPEDNEVGNRYRVWVKNEEILVKSSDFLEYEEDEQVSLLKTWREGGDGSGGGSVGPASETEEASGNFTWQDLELLDTGEELTREWVIVPAEFYGTAGGSVGGV